MGRIGITEIIVIIAIIIFARYLIKVKGTSKNVIEKKGSSVDIAIKNSEELISANFNKAKKYAQKSISKSFLTGCSWILVNENEENILFTFRTNDELLITTNGIVERCQYELIIDNNSILITKSGIIEHYNIVNIQDDFLLLNRLSSNKIMVFANQTKFKDEMKSVINQKAKEIYNYQNIQ